jgi:molybdenum cofactor synthesis domain-containing protein
MSEAGTKLKAAILVVSDTASKDASTDKCIPVLKDVFDSVGGNQWELAETAIVPDDVLAIQKIIRDWSDCAEPVNLIVTSGGTGFATKDVTPEVSSRLAIPWSKLTRKGCYSSTRQTCSWACVSVSSLHMLCWFTNSGKPRYAHNLLCCNTLYVPITAFLKERLRLYSCAHGKTCSWCSQAHSCLDFAWITQGRKRESGSGS